jgi:large subunit ribosomal protein L4
MPKVKMFKMDGTQAGEIELNDSVFGQTIHEGAVHQMVVAQLANNRQGTQSALTRSEVRGGGAKPWRQKGTGRARHGSSRSPQWTGGGVVFAPKPRSYELKVNKKVKRLAMTSALSMKVKEDDLIVLDQLELKQAKTKEVVNMLKALNAEGKVLFITAQTSQDLLRASGNLPGVAATPACAISVYDIVNCKKVIFTQDAVAAVEGVYS